MEAENESSLTFFGADFTETIHPFNVKATSNAQSPKKGFSPGSGNEHKYTVQ